MSDTTRRRLPNRREHELIDFEHAGFRYVAGIGRFDDGQLAEVFLNSRKSGTIEAVARDAAVTASIALQHGASRTELQHALMRDGNGAASSPLGTVLDILAADAP